MPRPVCVKCRREMTLVKPVSVMFNALATGGAYEAYMGDLARCGGCGAEVVARWAMSPFWRHHYPPLLTEPIALVVEEVPRA